MSDVRLDSVRYARPTIDLARPVEVAPGLLWLRLPLPFALDHVNVWLIDESDGWTLIDAGIGDDRTRAIWETLLAGPLAGRPIRRVIATHFHPDHMGLCGWLAERFAAPFLTSRTEWLQGRLLALDASDGYIAAGRAYDEAAGLAAEMVAARAARGNRYRLAVHPPPGAFDRLQAGDTIALGGGEWRVLVGQGHSPEMLTFYSPERNLLIAADQVLPRISPVVAVWPSTPEEDPLGDFLRSLEQYLALPGDCLVLPSHDAPYQGLHARIHALIRHHEERLAQTLAAAAESRTIAEIMVRLFRRRLDPHQLGFALGESVAHLNHLRRQGRIVEVGRRGAARLFRASPSERF